jgi:hypothetical protein
MNEMIEEFGTVDEISDKRRTADYHPERCEMYLEG